MKVVVQLLNLSVLAQDLNILHFLVDKLIEFFDQLFLQLMSKLVTCKVAQSLIDQPEMNVRE